MSRREKKSSESTVLETVILLQQQYHRIELSLRAAKRSSTLATREKHLQAAIRGLVGVEASTHALSEWWKRWVAGYCFECQGDGKNMESTGDPRHPLRAVKCTECKGTGKVQGRKIPSGWKIHWV